MKKLMLLHACLCLIAYTLYAQTNCTFKISVDTIYHVKCYGASDGAISVKTMNGAPPFRYKWSTGDSSKDIYNIGAGAYNITITDANGYQDSLLNIKVNQDTPVIRVTTTPTTNGMDGTATITITKPTFTFSRTFTNLKTGNHRLTVTDNAACSYSFTVTISNATAINDLNTEGVEKFDIFQNTNNNVRINLAFNEQKDFNLGVFTINGQLVYNQSFKAKEMPLNISNLPSGLLLFSLKIKDKIITKKAVLIK